MTEKLEEKNAELDSPVDRFVMWQEFTRKPQDGYYWWWCGYDTDSPTIVKVDGNLALEIEGCELLIENDDWSGMWQGPITMPAT